MVDATSKGKIQWMYGDGGGIFHAMAKFNPGRWSDKMDYEVAIEQLQELMDQNCKKPILLEVTLPCGRKCGQQYFDNVQDAIAQIEERLKTLPILIVPGFVCSGLRVVRSSVCPDWEEKEGKHGKRVWLDLPRIGFSTVTSGGTWEETNEGEKKLKNKWLQHLTLKSPTEEADGVELGVIPGVDGVKFLDPNLLFGLAAGPTRIFADVVKTLLSMGYKENEDLIAETFDWRFAPGVLQDRYRYFSRLVEAIEKLDKHATGVIIFAHSMGNKVVQYFFEWAKKEKGQYWLDQHVRVWLASAAPHVGALQAVNATLYGDRFGLDAFLSLSEARVMARSYSSSPWMFPLGSMQSAMFVRRQGVLEIKGLRGNFKSCDFADLSNDVGICIEIDWGDGRSKDSLDSSRSMIDHGSVCFPPESNFMQFAGPAALQKDITIIAYVKEYPTQSVASPHGHVLDFAKAVVTDGMKVLGENIHGRYGIGVPRAKTGPESIPKESNNRKFEKKCLSLASAGYPDDAGDFVEFEYRWLDFRAVREEWIGSAELTNRGPELSGLLKHQKRRDEVYDHIGLEQLMDMEGCRETVAQVWKSYYEEDPMFNSVGVDDCPPINEVLSVHGVNVPTDVGYAFRINTARFDTKVELTTRLELDDEAMLIPDYRAHTAIAWKTLNGYIPAGDDLLCKKMTIEEAKIQAEALPGCKGFCFPGPPVRAAVDIFFKSQATVEVNPDKKFTTLLMVGSQEVAITSGNLRFKNGILLEEPNPGKRPCGDGVVPIHSLDHSENWKDKLEFNIDRIEGAEHKVVLHGEAFSKILLDRILWKLDGWSKECTLEFGPEYEALEGEMPVFDGEAHPSVQHTVASLNAGRLYAVAGHCIAYSKKHEKYYLLYRKGRLHAARSKLGPKWKTILDNALAEKCSGKGSIDD